MSNVNRSSRQKIVGNWLRRNDGLNRAISEFFRSGGLGGIDSEGDDCALQGKRRHMTTHLDYDLVGTMNEQIVAQREIGSWWSPWEVVSLAVQRFLDAGEFDQKTTTPHDPTD